MHKRHNTSGKNALANKMVVPPSSLGATLNDKKLSLVSHAMATSKDSKLQTPKVQMLFPAAGLASKYTTNEASKARMKQRS